MGEICIHWMKSNIGNETIKSCIKVNNCVQLAMLISFPDLRLFVFHSLYSVLKKFLIMVKDMRHEIYHLDHFQVYSAVRLTSFGLLSSHLHDLFSELLPSQTEILYL